MKPLTPVNISTTIRHKLSVQRYDAPPMIDGVEIEDMKVFSDEGGSFMEISRFVNERLQHWQDFEIKQLNYAEMLPGVIKGTHLHFRQEDIWFVPPSNRLLVGLMDCRVGSATEGGSMRLTLGAGRARLLFIPRGVAHAVANLWDAPAGMLYLVNNAFDPDPEKGDEKRLPWDIFGEDFWLLAKE